MAPDLTILVAAQKYSGGNSHRILGLAHTYNLACQFDNVELARKAKHELYEALAAKTRAAPD